MRELLLLLLVYCSLLPSIDAVQLIPGATGRAAQQLREIQELSGLNVADFNPRGFSDDQRINEDLFKLSCQPESSELKISRCLFKLNNIYLLESTSNRASYKDMEELWLKTLFYDAGTTMPFRPNLTHVAQFAAVSGRNGNEASMVSVPVAHGADVTVSLWYYYLKGSGTPPKLTISLRKLKPGYTSSNVEGTTTLINEVECMPPKERKCVLRNTGTTLYEPFVVYIKISNMYDTGALINTIQFKLDQEYNPPSFDPKPTCWVQKPERPDLVYSSNGNIIYTKTIRDATKLTNVNDMNNGDFGSDFEAHYQRVRFGTMQGKKFTEGRSTKDGMWERRSTQIDPTLCGKAITSPKNPKSWPSGTYLYADLAYDANDNTFIYVVATPLFRLVKNEAYFQHRAWLTPGARVKYYLVYGDKPTTTGTYFEIEETARSKSNAMQGNPERQVKIPLSKETNQIHNGDKCKPFRIMMVVTNGKPKKDPTSMGDFAFFDDFKLVGDPGTSWPTGDELPNCEEKADAEPFPSVSSSQRKQITNPDDCSCLMPECYFFPSSSGDQCSSWKKLPDGASSAYISEHIGMSGSTNGGAVLNEYNRQNCKVALQGPKILASVDDLAIEARVFDTDSDKAKSNGQPKFCAVFADGSRKCKDVSPSGRPGPVSSKFSKEDLQCKPFSLDFEYNTPSDSGKIIVDDLKLSDYPKPKLAISDIDVMVCKNHLPELLKPNDGSKTKGGSNGGTDDKGHSDYDIQPFPSTGPSSNTPKKPEDSPCSFDASGTCEWKFLDKYNKPLGSKWQDGTIQDVNPSKQGSNGQHPVVVIAPKTAFVDDAGHKVNDYDFPRNAQDGTAVVATPTDDQFKLATPPLKPFISDGKLQADIQSTDPNVQYEACAVKNGEELFCVQEDPRKSGQPTSNHRFTYPVNKLNCEPGVEFHLKAKTTKPAYVVFSNPKVSGETVDSKDDCLKHLGPKAEDWPGFGEKKDTARNPTDCTCSDPTDPTACFWFPSNTGKSCSTWKSIKNADANFVRSTFGVSGSIDSSALMAEYTGQNCDMALEGPKVLGSLGPMTMEAKVWDTDSDKAKSNGQPEFCAKFDDGTEVCKKVENTGRPGPLRSSFTKDELRCKPFKLGFKYRTPSSSGKVVVDDIQPSVSPALQLAQSNIDKLVCEGELPQILKTEPARSGRTGNGYGGNSPSGPSSSVGIAPFPGGKDKQMPSGPLRPDQVNCAFTEEENNGYNACPWQLLDKDDKPLETQWKDNQIKDKDPNARSDRPVVVTAPKEAFVDDADRKLHDTGKFNPDTNSVVVATPKQDEFKLTTPPLKPFVTDGSIQADIRSTDSNVELEACAVKDGKELFCVKADSPLFGNTNATKKFTMPKDRLNCENVQFQIRAKTSKPAYVTFTNPQVGGATVDTKEECKKQIGPDEESFPAFPTKTRSGSDKAIPECFCDGNYPDECFFFPPTNSPGAACSKWTQLPNGINENQMQSIFGYGQAIKSKAMSFTYNQTNCPVEFNGPKIPAALTDVPVSVNFWDTDKDKAIANGEPKICAIFEDKTKVCEDLKGYGRPGPLKATLKKEDLKCKPFTLSLQYKAPANRGRVVLDDLQLTDHVNVGIATSELDVMTCQNKLPPLIKPESPIGPGGGDKNGNVNPNGNNNGNSGFNPQGNGDNEHSGDDRGKSGDKSGGNPDDMKKLPYPGTRDGHPEGGNSPSTPEEVNQCKFDAGTNKICKWRVLDRDDKPVATKKAPNGEIVSANPTNDQEQPFVVTVPPSGFLPNASNTLNDPSFKPDTNSLVAALPKQGGDVVTFASGPLDYFTTPAGLEVDVHSSDPNVKLEACAVKDGKTLFCVEEDGHPNNGRHKYTFPNTKLNCQNVELHLKATAHKPGYVSITNPEITGKTTKSKTECEKSLGPETVPFPAMQTGSDSNKTHGGENSFCTFENGCANFGPTTKSDNCAKFGKVTKPISSDQMTAIFGYGSEVSGAAAYAAYKKAGCVLEFQGNKLRPIMTDLPYELKVWDTKPESVIGSGDKNAPQICAVMDNGREYCYKTTTDGGKRPGPVRGTISKHDLECKPFNIKIKYDTVENSGSVMYDDLKPSGAGVAFVNSPLDLNVCKNKLPQIVKPTTVPGSDSSSNGNNPNGGNNNNGGYGNNNNGGNGNNPSGVNGSGNTGKPSSIADKQIPFPGENGGSQDHTGPFPPQKVQCKFDAEEARSVEKVCHWKVLDRNDKPVGTKENKPPNGELVPINPNANPESDPFVVSVPPEGFTNEAGKVLNSEPFNPDTNTLVAGAPKPNGDTVKFATDQLEPFITDGVLDADVRSSDPNVKLEACAVQIGQKLFCVKEDAPLTGQPKENRKFTFPQKDLDCKSVEFHLKATTSKPAYITLNNPKVHGTTVPTTSKCKSTIIYPKVCPEPKCKITDQPPKSTSVSKEPSSPLGPNTKPLECKYNEGKCSWTPVSGDKLPAQDPLPAYPYNKDKIHLDECTENCVVPSDSVQPKVEEPAIVVTVPAGNNDPGHTGLANTDWVGPAFTDVQPEIRIVTGDPKKVQLTTEMCFVTKETQTTQCFSNYNSGAAGIGYKTNIYNIPKDRLKCEQFRVFFKFGWSGTGSRDNETKVVVDNIKFTDATRLGTGSEDDKKVCQFGNGNPDNLVWPPKVWPQVPEPTNPSGGPKLNKTPKDTTTGNAVRTDPFTCPSQDKRQCAHVFRCEDSKCGTNSTLYTPKHGTFPGTLVVTPPGTDVGFHYQEPPTLFGPIKSPLQSFHYLELHPANSVNYQACARLKKEPSKEVLCVDGVLKPNSQPDTYSAYFQIPDEQLHCDEFYLVYKVKNKANALANMFVFKDAWNNYKEVSAGDNVNCAAPGSTLPTANPDDGSKGTENFGTNSREQRENQTPVIGCKDYLTCFYNCAHCAKAHPNMARIFTVTAAQFAASYKAGWQTAMGTSKHPEDQFIGITLKKCGVGNTETCFTNFLSSAFVVPHGSTKTVANCYVSKGADVVFKVDSIIVVNGRPKTFPGTYQGRCNSQNRLEVPFLEADMAAGKQAMLQIHVNSASDFDVFVALDSITLA